VIKSHQKYFTSIYLATMPQKVEKRRQLTRKKKAVQTWGPEATRHVVAWWEGHNKKNTPWADRERDWEELHGEKRNIASIRGKYYQMIKTENLEKCVDDLKVMEEQLSQSFEPASGWDERPAEVDDDDDDEDEELIERESMFT
jgi:hypothetical protein